MKEPMCAKQADRELRFPVYASPKIDGIRCIIKDGIALSRTLLPLPNIFIQDTIGFDVLNGLDGEICVGPPNAPDLMQRTSSAVMSRQGEPDFTFWVFDYWTDPARWFEKRWMDLQTGMTADFKERFPRVKLLPQAKLDNQEQLDEFEQAHVTVGFEGVMTRVYDGIYKYGRSTTKQQYLLKHKRFEDAEAVVIGFEERLHNGNDAKVDERGYTKRSSHQANLIPMDTLGALLVREPITGVEFSIGTGFDDTLRAHIWRNKSSYLGQFVTYKTFKQTGVKNKPRFPTFKAFRHTMDIGK